MKPLLAVVAVTCLACGHHDRVATTAVTSIPGHEGILSNAVPPERGRLVPPEVFLRAYLTWFGGLLPKDVQKLARGRDLFTVWNDYLGALGLPDYHLDIPRAGQSNTIMLATIGRLGEALCMRAAEHDLAHRPAGGPPLIFTFDVQPAPTPDEFARGFDVLHRTFLGYPASLAPADRVARFYKVFQTIVASHQGVAGPLTPEQTGWAMICTALVQHPEMEMY